MDDERGRRHLPQRRTRVLASSGDAGDEVSSPGRRLELAFILNESESDRGFTRRPSQPRDRLVASAATAAAAASPPVRVDLWRPQSPLEFASQRRRVPSASTSWLVEETKDWIADGVTFDENEEKTDAVQNDDTAPDIQRLTLQEPAIPTTLTTPATAAAAAAATVAVGASAAPAQALSREEKRKGRTCRVDGCDNYIVHKGLCCRHGGARKCSTEGCESTAKYMGLCWKHGGSTWCKVAGCSKRAKAKGKCWAHGGGTQCGHVDCTKVAVSNGLCWAHGGGKRCLVDGCNRPGYERTNGFCDRHYEEVQHKNYFEV